MIACAAKGISRIQPSRSSGCPLVWTEKDLRRLGEGRSGRGGPQRGAKGHRRRPLDFAPGNPRRQNRKSKLSKSEIPGVRYFFTAMVPNASRHAHGSLGVRTPGVSWRRRREPPGVELFYGVGRGDLFLRLAFEYLRRGRRPSHSVRHPAQTLRRTLASAPTSHSARLSGNGHSCSHC